MFGEKAVGKMSDSFSYWWDMLVPWTINSIFTTSRFCWGWRKRRTSCSKTTTGFLMGQKLEQQYPLLVTGGHPREKPPNWIVLRCLWYMIGFFTQTDELFVMFHKRVFPTAIRFHVFFSQDFVSSFCWIGFAGFSELPKIIIAAMIMIRTRSSLITIFDN